MGFLFIGVTLLGVIVGQLCIKSGMLQVAASSPATNQPWVTLLNAFSNPRVVFGLLMAVVAASAWILTLSKLPLSYAYPFMSLTFPIVVILSARIFEEPISPRAYLGLGLIVMGLIIASSRPLP